MKLVKKWVVVIILIIGAFAQESAYADGKLSDAPQDWMSKLNPDTELSKINIPGTHDSGSYTLEDPVKSVWAKTQDKDYKTQLEQGIRFLDIRGRATSDSSIGIHHGMVYLHHNFGDVLDTAKQFLQAHPNETIVLSMKKDHTPADGVTKDFNTIFKENYFESEAYRDLFYHGNNPNPKLSDVKGKIVLLNRMGSTSVNSGYGVMEGIDWKDNASFDTTMNGGQLKLSVQDEYKDNQAPKLQAIKGLLDKSYADNSEKAVYINFLSVSSGGTALNSPYAYASNINPEIAKYINEHTQQRTGWVIMDYSGYTWSGYPDITEAVINSNKA